MVDTGRSVSVVNQYAADSWCLPPAVPGLWVDLDEKRAKLISARLSEVSTKFVHPDIRGGVNVELVRILPSIFYDGWLICEMQIRAEQPSSYEKDDNADDRRRAALRARGILTYLYGPDGFVALDGRADAIHFHNSHYGADLSSDEKRQAYLRFFCFSVHGQDGPFLIREATSEIDLVRAELAAGEMVDVENALKPVHECEDPDANSESCVYQACIQYGSTLFASRLSVFPNGTVEMLDDRPLLKNVISAVPTVYNMHFRHIALAEII